MNDFQRSKTIQNDEYKDVFCPSNDEKLQFESNALQKKKMDIENRREYKVNDDEQDLEEKNIKQSGSINIRNHGDKKANKETNFKIDFGGTNHDHNLKISAPSMLNDEYWTNLKQNIKAKIHIHGEFYIHISSEDNGEEYFAINDIQSLKDVINENDIEQITIKLWITVDTKEVKVNKYIFHDEEDNIWNCR